MDALYVIWSGPFQGWLTGTATYSSDLADAKRLTRDDAIRACQAHKDQRTGNFGWLPVYVKDLDAMKERK